MTTLSNAPLIYTIGMVRFTKVPKMERFTESFFDKIRKEYPHSEIDKVNLYSAHIGIEGVKIDTEEAQTWQFSAVDNSWAFVLTDQSFCLHTRKNHSFANEFSPRLEAGLTALLSVPDIGISWVTMLGMRYVDLIVPDDGRTLSDYLNEWLLPALPTLDVLKKGFLDNAHVARFQSPIGNLKIQVFRNPEFTFPPEIQSPAIARHKWVPERPDKEFALIDTDHVIAFPESKAIDVKEVIKTLGELETVCDDAFRDMGTKFAFEQWDKK